MSNRDHRPPEPSRASTSPSLKLVLLWLVLLVIFVVVYRVSDGRIAELRDTAAWPALAYAVPLLVVLYAGIRVAILMRATRKVNQLMEPAMVAAANNNYAKAETIYREICQRFQRPRDVAGMPRNNLADSLMRQGKLRDAIDTLIPLYDQDDTLGLGSIVALNLTKLFALTGQLELADLWLETAERSVDKDLARVNRRGLLIVTRALVLCRREHFADALSLFEREWTQLESLLTVSQMCEARLLRGYAALRTSSVREASDAYRWLGQDERGPKTQYLATEWPELRVALEAA